MLYLINVLTGLPQSYVVTGIAEQYKCDEDKQSEEYTHDCQPSFLRYIITFASKEISQFSFGSVPHLIIYGVAYF